MSILPFGDLPPHKWQLVDLIGDAVYERDGNDLYKRGLYLDEPSWKAQVSLTEDPQLMSVLSAAEP
jgi:hypothetical protein